MASLGARVVLAVSKAARSAGAAMDNLGAKLEVAKYSEKLVPSTRFVAVDGVAPVLSSAATFVAPSASLVGDVTMGNKSSVWYGAVVRGDVNKVTIGDQTAIRERAVVHVAKIQGDFATKIGDNVTVGPCAIIHACTLHDSVMVGASAQVLDGAVVESNSIVAPGAIVTPGTTVKGGEYWAGSPARKVRDLTPEEIASIVHSATDLADLAMMHAVENAKDYKQVIADEEARIDKFMRNDDYMQPNQGDPDDFLGQGAPGRIFNTVLSNPVEGIKFRQKQAEETAAKVAALEKAKKNDAF